LPEDPTFNQFNNHYDVASYKRLCSEFSIYPSSDFRFTRGANNGLGSVYQYVDGPSKTTLKYPGWNKFSDEGGKAIKGDLIYFIEQDDVASGQADWFAPNTASGLTQAGLSRINQSIEAFVYCILGAQVNVRSSILESGGRAKEAQSEFLVLIEDSIRKPDLAESVQRYQLAVDEAKVRLNLAVAPNAWLMPAKMIINTQSTVGYNNKLKQAVSGMKLVVNNTVNPDTKKAALKLMEGGPSKINPPNSHPSNPIHKAATAESKTETRAPVEKIEPTVQDKTAPDKTPQHEINKTAGYWCGRVIGFAVHGLAVKLTSLLKIFFEQKGHHSKNEQPGVLCQKPNSLARSFEQKARNRAYQPWQQRSKFSTNIFQAFPQSFASGFQSFCD